MTHEIRLHRDAERELRVAFLWYFDRNPIVAESFRAEAEHAIRAIAESPDRWPRITDAVRGYVLPRFPFTMVYRASPNAIEIIAMAHQKRSPGYWDER